MNKEISIFQTELIIKKYLKLHDKLFYQGCALKIDKPSNDLHKDGEESEKCNHKLPTF